MSNTIYLNTNEMINPDYGISDISNLISDSSSNGYNGPTSLLEISKANLANLAKKVVKPQLPKSWYSKFLKSNGQWDISLEDLKKWGNQFGDENTRNTIKSWGNRTTKLLWKLEGADSGIDNVFKRFTNWVKDNGATQGTGTTNDNYTYHDHTWDFNKGTSGQVNTTVGTVNPYKSTPFNAGIQASDALLKKNYTDVANAPLPKITVDSPAPSDWNRSLTRNYMRSKNINPYDYTGAERKALRMYLNGDTTEKNYDINLLRGSELGNKLNLKFQRGGSINMDESQLQRAFLLYLMQKTGALDQQLLEQVILQMGEDGLKLAYAQFMQEMLLQQVQSAKFGAKLNYIRQLNGQCPEGTLLQYYKVGGRLCKKCMLIKLNSTEEPSDPIKAFKCGRKIKKHELKGFRHY